MNVQQTSSAVRDKSMCHFCKKHFQQRNLLYAHYSLDHLSHSLKEFMNDHTCTLCGNVFSGKHKLLLHIGVKHNKVEQFLDVSLHIPKRQRIYHSQNIVQKKCNICAKIFPDDRLLKYHTIIHFKEELDVFINKAQMMCNICHFKFKYLCEVRRHVAIAHEKLREVNQQQSPEEHSTKELELDLYLSDTDDNQE